LPNERVCKDNFRSNLAIVRIKVFQAQTLSETEFDEIVSVLRSGGVIGFPTDTAYGLGADPYNEQAVRKVFDLKGRPETKPILLLVNSLEMAEAVVLSTGMFNTLARTFWPGPLTLILRAQPNIPAWITAGTGNVGIRWPSSGFAAELVRRLEQPITATSANKSGLPSCITATEVQSQLGDSLPILVDGGELSARGGSTLLDLTTEPPTLLREGPISLDKLQVRVDGRIRRAIL